jgi:hypothetical protein
MIKTPPQQWDLEADVVSIGSGGGITNARGMTHGYLAGRHAAGNPSDLLAREIERLNP